MAIWAVTMVIKLYKSISNLDTGHGSNSITPESKQKTGEF